MQATVWRRLMLSRSSLIFSSQATHLPVPSGASLEFHRTHLQLTKGHNVSASFIPITVNSQVYRFLVGSMRVFHLARSERHGTDRVRGSGCYRPDLAKGS